MKHLARLLFVLMLLMAAAPLCAQDDIDEEVETVDDGKGADADTTAEPVEDEEHTEEHDDAAEETEPDTTDSEENPNLDPTDTTPTLDSLTNATLPDTFAIPAGVKLRNKPAPVTLNLLQFSGTGGKMNLSLELPYDGMLEARILSGEKVVWRSQTPRHKGVNKIFASVKGVPPGKYELELYYKGLRHNQAFTLNDAMTIVAKLPASATNKKPTPSVTKTSGKGTIKSKK